MDLDERTTPYMGPFSPLQTDRSFLEAPDRSRHAISRQQLAKLVFRSSPPTPTYTYKSQIECTIDILLFKALCVWFFGTIELRSETTATVFFCLSFLYHNRWSALQKQVTSWQRSRLSDVLRWVRASFLSESPWAAFVGEEGPESAVDPRRCTLDGGIGGGLASTAG